METPRRRSVLALLIILVKLTSRPTLSLEDTYIRLVGGNYPSEGRVEVLGLSGDWPIWGTVCDDRWDYNEAEVVCRQLGYGGYIKYTDEAAFGEGTGPILLDEVACTGSESRLQECDYNANHDCNHYEDAGVVCQLPGYLGCFRDSGRDRVLPHNPLKDSAVDALLCIKRCFDGGYAFAGVRRGDECYCGLEDTEYDRQGTEAEDDCNMACDGDGNLLCGGRDRIGVFDVRKAHCPDPGLPPDGARTGDSFVFGSMVNFSCREEFEFIGEARLQCLLKRKPGSEDWVVAWNAEIPECQGPSTPAVETTQPVYSTSPTSSMPEISPTLTPNTGAISLGVIIGPIVGAVLLLVILLLAFLAHQFRRRKSTTDTDHHDNFPKRSSFSTEDHYYSTARPPADLPVYYSVTCHADGQTELVEPSQSRQDVWDPAKSDDQCSAEHEGLVKNTIYEGFDEDERDDVKVPTTQVTQMKLSDPHGGDSEPERQNGAVNSDAAYSLLYEDDRMQDGVGISDAGREGTTVVPSQQSAADQGYSLLYDYEDETKGSPVVKPGAQTDADLSINWKTEDQFSDHIYGDLDGAE